MRLNSCAAVYSIFYLCNINILRVFNITVAFYIQINYCMVIITDNYTYKMVYGDCFMKITVTQIIRE